MQGKQINGVFSLIIHLFILLLPDMQQILYEGKGQLELISYSNQFPFEEESSDVPGSPVVETWASNAGYQFSP